MAFEFRFCDSLLSRDILKLVSKLVFILRSLVSFEDYIINETPILNTVSTLIKLFIFKNNKKNYHSLLTRLFFQKYQSCDCAHILIV